MNRYRPCPRESRGGLILAVGDPSHIRCPTRTGDGEIYSSHRKHNHGEGYNSSLRILWQTEYYYLITITFSADLQTTDSTFTSSQPCLRVTCRY
jgi:hypothetical protein